MTKETRIHICKCAGSQVGWISVQLCGGAVALDSAFVRELEEHSL